MEVSLALGGGGIKGLAHIGVFECLSDAGINVAAIAGSSIGGLVGAVYAAGYCSKEIQSLVSHLNHNKLYKRQPTDGPSLLGYHGLAEALTEVLGETRFSDLKIPFACTAVDLKTAQEVYLNKGSVLEAALATIAVPGIFPAKRLGDLELIDGGVIDPVPVNLARCLAPTKPVIAVALNPEKSQWNQIPELNILPTMALPIPPPLMDGLARMRFAQALRIFLHSMDITARMLTEMRLEVDHPEVIIRPNVHQYGLLDVVEPEVLIRAGYVATEQALPEIRKALSWGSSVLRILRSPLNRRVRREEIKIETETPVNPPTTLPCETP